MSDSVTGSAGRFLVAGLVSMGQDVEGAINAVSDAQREAVEPWRKYAEHNAECGVYTIGLMNDRLACTCGLSALLGGKTDE